jgi:hypothetical protein
LLSNVDMRRLVLGWKRPVHERHLGACIVSYADEALLAMQNITRRQKQAAAATLDSCSL